jgi:predicted DNA-binding WGR domain protein
MPRFERVEGASSKFWEIVLAGRSFTTTYGRMGSVGQSTKKAFASDAKAASEYEKLIGAKLRKGYVAVKGSHRGAAPKVSRDAGGRVAATTGNAKAWRAAYQALPGARAVRAPAVVSCKNGASVRTSVIPPARLAEHASVVGTVAGLVDKVALGLVPLNDGDDGHVVFVSPQTKQALVKILGPSFATAFEEQVGIAPRSSAAAAPVGVPTAGAPPKDKRLERELARVRRFSDKDVQGEIKYAQRRIQKARATGDREEILFGMHHMEKPLRWRGTRDLAKGVAGGWKDVLDAAWLTIIFYDRFRVRGMDPAGSVAAPLLLVLGLDGWSKQLGRVVSGMEAVAAKARGSERNDGHVVYFALFCAELMAKGRAKPRGPGGPLQRLAQHALDKTLTPKLLADACAFQVKNGGITDDDGMELSSYALIPVWWFALAKARAARGLPTPRPFHALFATPLANLPDPPSYDRASNPLIAQMAKL